MDFKSFFQSLNENQRTEFASVAGTTVGYIKTHLVYGRKVPQRETFDGLIKALNQFKAGITRQDLLHFFYPPSQEEVDGNR
jgi:hypothetical protein